MTGAGGWAGDSLVDVVLTGTAQMPNVPPMSLAGLHSHGGSRCPRKDVETQKHIF